MATDSADLFPCPPQDSLRKEFVGKQLSDVPTPAAVLDRAVVQRNCRQMLDSCKALGVKFRAHIKTHKVLWPCFVTSLFLCWIPRLRDLTN